MLEREIKMKKKDIYIYIEREREREREKEESVESVEFRNAPSIQGFDESFFSFNSYSLSLSLNLICIYGNFICFFFITKLCLF